MISYSICLCLTHSLHMIPSRSIHVAANGKTLFSLWLNITPVCAYIFVHIKFSSVAQLSPTLCDPMDCSMSGLPVHLTWNLLKLMSIESVMPSSHLILCHPLLLLPSIFPSIRVFSNESAPLIKVAKVLEFQLQHQSFQ